MVNENWGSSILICREDMSCKPQKIMENISYFNHTWFLSISGFSLGVDTLPNLQIYTFTLEKHLKYFRFNSFFFVDKKQLRGVKWNAQGYWEVSFHLFIHWIGSNMQIQMSANMGCFKILYWHAFLFINSQSFYDCNLVIFVLSQGIYCQIQT